MAETYNPSNFSDKEVAMMQKFTLQRDDAKQYFESVIRPRLDRSYKLYVSYNGDRAAEIKRLGKTWMANVFVPYVHAVVETLMPRILDARPEFIAQGRTEEDQLKSAKLQITTDYTWEIANMDDVSETLVRSSLVYGTGYLQVSWKKDVREYEFLSTKDLVKKKYRWKKEKKVYYDAPFAEAVDNYSLWYDWHNVPRQSKQFWFKRLILTGGEIKRRYPAYDKKRIGLAFSSGSGDLTDYASIRNDVKYTHNDIIRGADYVGSTAASNSNIYQNQNDPELKMYEVFEWTRPFEDAYAVLVNNVPILKGGVMPIVYDFKESAFIEVPYLKLPFEFEGVGLPMILENPQIMLNTIKNQRLDSVTLGIHKMWIVNPLANVNKKELVTRPFGIIYSADPNGVREVQFSDVKASAYKEEEFLKSDMRYASGVDDFSMAAGGGASSATEVRHLRESTLERVRLFINHLGSAYSLLMRYWVSMYRQFMTEEMTIRIIGKDGKEAFPLIEKDDLMGEFDFKAAVIPSIAGKNDIDKKQGMDLFQLLISLPFVDPRKLTSKVLHSWNWSLDSVSKAEGTPEMEGSPEEQAAAEMQGLPPGMQPPPEMGGEMGEEGPTLPRISGGDVPQEVIQQALSMLGGQSPQGMSPFGEASGPINLLGANAMPPTAPGIKLPTTNPRGFNRTGRVNTNIPLKNTSTPEGNLANRATNIQS